MTVSITPAAAKQVTRYLAKRGSGVGVRLGVKTTGCSGLAYKLEYVDSVKLKTKCLKTMASKSSSTQAAYIDGTQLDFVREGLNEGFKFSNPNERDRCGCGGVLPLGQIGLNFRLHFFNITRETCLE